MSTASSETSGTYQVDQPSFNCKTKKSSKYLESIVDFGNSLREQSLDRQQNFSYLILEYLIGSILPLESNAC